MIDPRSESEEKLVPPSPLPHVSRRALKRVKNAIPAPTECPYCKGPVVLVNNKVIYVKQSYGDWPYAYLCKPCRAYVGLHPDTDVPLGTLADKRLRESRKLSKALFHEWITDNCLGRGGAYLLLAEKMGISVDVCHFGWFTEDQCLQAINAINSQKP